MADYIDRKELIDFIKLPDNPLSQNEFMRNFIIGMIIDAPSIDAVEVVRCKDCKHYKSTGVCKLLFTVTSNNFYCANGVKKNERNS